MILHAVQTFEGTPQEVFPFFADAHNLERITPGFLKFRVLTPAPIPMRDGTTIDYALRINGIPLKWRSEILDWQPNVRFTDRQLRGPYSKWVHQHRFVARGDTTEMHDHVEYAVPGPVFIERLIVRRQLRQIFEYRQDVLASIFREAAPARLYIGAVDPGIGSATLGSRSSA
jgi:ligand-binding SRPBCC domain-containing protein